MKTLIIIPAYNEELNIKKVVDNIIMNYPQYDYVVVNDGSKDNTAGICYANNYNIIDLPVNLGLAGGFQTGLKYAYKLGYDYAIQFDGDGQHRPEYIEPIRMKMEEGYDIVIGSRYVEKKKPHSLRMLGSFLLSCVIRFTTGQRIKDPTSGMRMLNARMIKEFALNMNYGPEPDTISYLIKNGAKVAEVQAEMDERTEGQSYLTPAKATAYMLRMVISIVFIQIIRQRDKRYIM